MATGLKALPFAIGAQVLALVAAVMVLVWTIHFRGGLAWEAQNKNLIFNRAVHYRGQSGIRSIRDARRRAAPQGCDIHPVLMLIGFIILGGEAIISYKSFPLKKEVKKVIHLVLHAIALILGIVGIYTAFKNHNESNIPNMYSLHSWIGIGVISLYGIQWIYGFVVFFYPGGSAEIRRDSLPWHVLFGMFVYVMAVGNACLGFLEKLTFLESGGVAKYGSEAFLVNFTAIATVLYGVFVFLTILSQAPIEDDYSYSAIS